MQRICTSGSGQNTCGRGYRWIPYVVSFVKRGTIPRLVNAREDFFFRNAGVWGSREHEHLRTGRMHEARGGNEGEPRLKGTACSWEGMRTCGLACTLCYFQGLFRWPFKRDIPGTIQSPRSPRSLPVPEETVPSYCLLHAGSF